MVKELSKLILDWSTLSLLSRLVGLSDDFLSVSELFFVTVVVAVVFPELEWFLVVCGMELDSDSLEELESMLASGNLS